MKTIAPSNLTIESLDLKKIIIHLAELEEEAFKRVIQSLIIEFSERQKISISDALKVLVDLVDELNSTILLQKEEKNNHKSLEKIICNLSNLLPDLKQRYGIKSLGIFGSYARKEETPMSDLDLLVDFEQNSSVGLIKICEIENYLTEQFGIQVDLTLLSEIKSQSSNNILSEVVYL